MGCAVLLRDPWAAPGGCSQPAVDRFWDRNSKTVDLDSPPQSPSLPQSSLVQVPDKNSRQRTVGEEQDPREARRGCDWSCKVGGPRRRDAPPLGREGPACSRRCLASPRRVRHTAPTQSVAPSTPCARLRIPQRPQPIPGSPFCSGAGGAGRGAARSVSRLRAHLEKSASSSRAPIAWSWGSGSQRGSAPRHPSPSSAAATQVARNRNRGRKKKEEDVKSNGKNQESV